MIIVTGGAGVIGSNLVRGLNRRGVTDVLVVDDLKDGDKHRSLNALAFEDLVDMRDFLEKLPSLGHVEAIFHQGACSNTMEASDSNTSSVTSISSRPNLAKISSPILVSRL